MKSLWKCEKCGKVYEEREDCEKCESLHYDFHNRQSWDCEEMAQQLDSMTEYKEGQEEPDKIVVWFEREYWNSEKAEWIREQRCAKYKLVSSFERPLIVTE